MEADHNTVYIAACGSFAAVVLLTLLVACIDEGRVKPASDIAACCTASRRWAFAPVPRRWPLRTQVAFQVALAVAAIAGVFGQSIALLLVPSTETLALLTTHNLLTLGVGGSHWAGEEFACMQSICVGVASPLIWIAAIFETQQIGAEATPGVSDGVLIVVLWVLAMCSALMFMFYVVVVGFCVPRTGKSALDAQLVSPPAYDGGATRVADDEPA